jgi:NAD(P)-dependent dehydrogenase (short-subunit alcohol dehydrogenase family)
VRRFDGRVAAVTVAGSGIGRALALELARRHAHLALSDVDEQGLGETADACRGFPVNVTAQRVDVAQREQVYAAAERVVADHGRVHLIVSNAGVGLGATVDLRRLRMAHGHQLLGGVHGTKAFLPHLKASGEGHVVNLSSVSGLIGVPTQSAYNAAKFAVRGFTDALRMELEIEGACVSATTIHPGGIKTNIARRARIDPSVEKFGRSATDVNEFDRLARTTPEEAARQILRAVERNRRRALVGPDAKAIDLLSRLPAALVQRLLVFGTRRRR